MPDPTDSRRSHEQYRQPRGRPPTNPPQERQTSWPPVRGQPGRQPPAQGQPPQQPPVQGQSRPPQQSGWQPSAQGSPGQPAPTPQRQPSDVQLVEDGERFVHVRFADPDAFETIRTPDWASHAADSVYQGAEVRTGRRRGSDDWATQSVLVPKPVDRGTAVAVARQIREKIGE